MSVRDLTKFRVLWIVPAMLLILSASSGVFGEEMSESQKSLAEEIDRQQGFLADKEDEQPKVVAQQTSQEKRIEELEKKLQNVTEELQELKSQGMADDRLKSVEEKISVLAEEIENIKQAAVVEEPTYEQKFGAAPAASKVYLTDRGLSIGGYGELTIATIEEDEDNVVDAQRAILYVGYKFTDRIIFNSELEFEHATTSSNFEGDDGSVSVEFALLDFLLVPEFNLRGGLLLQPLGIVNEVHEPTTFFGVHRPPVETQIIPSTTRENGLGAFGEFNFRNYGWKIPGVLSYRTYVMNSWDSRGFDDDNNRGLRVRGNRALFNDIAFVGRVEYDPFPGLKFGASTFIGQTGQNRRVDNEMSPLNGQKIDGLFQIYEGDVQFQYRGLELRGLLAWTFLDDVEEINANLGFEGDDSVGEEQFGWYVVGAYNLLSIANLESQYLQYFAPFVRYSMLDTQHEVPSGFSRNPANDRQELTFGLNYKPIPQVVIKTDYTYADNEADDANNFFSFGMGYVF